METYPQIYTSSASYFKESLTIRFRVIRSFLCPKHSGVLTLVPAYDINTHLPKSHATIQKTAKKQWFP